MRGDPYSAPAPDSAPPGRMGPGPRRRPRPLRAVVAAVAVAAAVAAMVFAVQPASAQSASPDAITPFSTQRGPDPTIQSIEATRGTFATAQMSVAPGNGFNGGVIYYLTDTSQGTWRVRRGVSDAELLAGRIPGSGDGDRGQLGDQRLDRALDTEQRPANHTAVERHPVRQRLERDGDQRLLQWLAGRWGVDHLRLHRQRHTVERDSHLHKSLTANRSRERLSAPVEMGAAGRHHRHRSSVAEP